MPSINIPVLLYSYGAFLILCGVVSVALIGMKAKTALASGGLAGSISILVGWLIYSQSSYAQSTGIFVTFALFCVFCWRSAKTFFTILKMMEEKSPNIHGKAIAFLVISLMAVVSIFATLLQISLFI